MLPSTGLVEFDHHSVHNALLVPTSHGMGGCRKQFRFRTQCRNCNEFDWFTALRPTYDAHCSSHGDVLVSAPRPLPDNGGLIDPPDASVAFFPPAVVYGWLTTSHSPVSSEKRSPTCCTAAYSRKLARVTVPSSGELVTVTSDVGLPLRLTPWRSIVRSCPRARVALSSD